MGLGKTEWEDILIEKGIIAPPKESTIEHHPDIIYDINNNTETEDEDDIDAMFEEEDEFIQQYKTKQLNKLKQLKEGEIFGSITEISRNDFLAEVTEASKKHPVLVYLYQTSVINCQVLAKWLANEAAPSNPSIKFVQILSTRCIQNYPDANLPTILLYRLGNVQKQLLQADIVKTQELIDQIIEAEKDHQQKNDGTKDQE